MCDLKLNGGAIYCVSQLISYVCYTAKQYVICGQCCKISILFQSVCHAINIAQKQNFSFSNFFSVAKYRYVMGIP